MSSATWYCTHCRHEVFGPRCTQCGERKEPGNPLPFFAWIFVPLLVPIYPIAGTFGSLALAAVALGGAYVGLGIEWIAPIAAIGVYASVFGTFRWEQRASNSRAYRILRDVLRIGAGAALIVVLLDQQNVDSEYGANVAFIAVIGIPLLFWLFKVLDRLFKAAGPRNFKTTADGKPIQAGPTFWNTLNWPIAMMSGFFAGVLGTLMGGLWFGALAWVAVGGLILGVQILYRLLGSAGRVATSANQKIGGVPKAIFWGLVLGAGAGAGLGKILDGRVQVEAVILVAIVGLVVSLIVNRVRRRRGATEPTS